LIAKCGGTPNATNGGQLAGLVTNLAEAKRLVMRDAHGRAKVAAPVETDDIARKAEVDAVLEAAEEVLAGNLPEGWGAYAEGYGRNLLDVLGAGTVAEAGAEIHRRCNNNGEIDGTGIPDFPGLKSGIILTGLTCRRYPPKTAGQAWNDTYKNNRIVVSGFNTYKGMGDTENTKNHILFTFRNIPLRKRMNSSDTNTGGYIASELRAFLEGTAGDGTGDKSGVTTAAFMNALDALYNELFIKCRDAAAEDKNGLYRKEKRRGGSSHES
jgi:hypothetical protein